MKVTTKLVVNAIAVNATSRSVGGSNSSTIKLKVIRDSDGLQVGEMLLSVREGAIQPNGTITRAKRKVTLHLFYDAPDGSRVNDTIRVEALCHPDRVDEGALVDLINSASDTLQFSGVADLSHFVAYGSFETK